MNRENDALLKRLQRIFQKMPKRMLSICCAGAILLLIVFIVLLRGCSKQKTSQANGAGNETVVKITALGNIQMSEDLLRSALQDDGTYDFSESFSAITAYTTSADYTVADLELNLCDPPYDTSPYRTPKSFTDCLTLCGIDLVQTVNSATVQNGITGAVSTLETLNAAGIDHVGSYASAEDYASSGGILIKNIRGVRIAFVAFSKGLGGLSLPEGKEYSADLLYEDYATDYAVLDEKAIVEKLTVAKEANPDVIIAMLHWGNEFDAAVSPKQETLVSLLMENGVQVILGTHPNNVGKMEKVERTLSNGKTASCYVAYSLGNFYTSNQNGYANESVVVDFEIRKNNDTGETTIENFSYVPIYIYEAKRDEASLYQIIPVRSAINSSLFKEIKPELTDCLARMRQNTESDFDAGT